MNLLERLKKIREKEKKNAEAEKFPADQTMYAIPIGEQEELDLNPKSKKQSSHKKQKSETQTESFIITSPELLAVEESKSVSEEVFKISENQKSDTETPPKVSESSIPISEKKKESAVLESKIAKPQETTPSSDFDSIKSKPKYSIQFKMMLVISLILGIAVSTIIFLATLFFKIDSKRAIETNTFELVRVLELKVRADLNSVVEKGKQLAITLNQSFKNPKQKDFLIDQFFKNDNDFIFLGVYSKEGNELKEVQTVFNKNYMEKVSMEEADVLSVISKNKPSFILSFNGVSVLFNASIGLEEPTICISVPPVQEINDKYVLVIMFKLEKILDAFNKSGISETFMVSGDGIVVAHSNPEYVKSAKNLSDNPIVRRLLSDPQPNYQTSYTDSNGRKFLGSYQKVKLGFSNLGVISVVPEDKAFEGVYAIQERNIYIMIISLCISLIIVFLFAKSISSPVLSLLSETVKIAQGDFKVSIKRTTNDEVGVLTEYFTLMAKGLEEREKVKSILGSMIDPVVVQEAMKDLLSLKRGSEKVITSFFSDVAGFSTISEQLTSVQLASLLNEYLSAMTIILQKHGGVLDKYIGDAIVGIFGAPVDVEEHYLKACRASVEMISKLDELKKYWVENNLYSKEAQEMDVRIGLNMGPAKVGFMGTDSMGSYTMMGDTVNLAARLEAAGKDYGVNILISEMVNEKVTHEMFTRELDKVRVKGKNEPVTIYELIGKIENVPENIRKSTKLYEQAFEHYLKREWEKAIELLEESIRIRGKKDKAANMLKERCASYLLNPPDETWDGVYTRTHK